MTSALVYGQTLLDVYDNNPPSSIIREPSGDTPRLAVNGASIGWSAEGFAIVSASYSDTPPANSVQTGFDLANCTINAGPPVTASIKRTWQAVTPPPATFTPLQFLSLFTQGEQLHIAASNDPQVRLIVAMAMGAQGVDLADQKTITGVNYLASQGLITAQRAAEILASTAPA